MSLSKEDVVEAHLRFAGSAQLFINLDASWSIGKNTNSMVLVRLGSTTSIDDDTFGYSAIAVEAVGSGYILYAESDADESTIVQVSVDATGNVDVASLMVLTPAQLDAVENRLSVDLDSNGGFGGEPVVVEGGATNLYMTRSGSFALGGDANSLTTLSLGGQPLTTKLLPVGWQIVEVVPSSSGYGVYAQAPTREVFAASFSSSGQFNGGDLLSATQLAATETALGVDINGDNSLPAPAGWTSVLKTASIKAAVDAAVAGNGQITHAQISALMAGLIQEHKSAGNTPLSGTELADLQAIASRGKALFVGAAGDATATDYLSFVFSKMVEGSVANNFYTGGQDKAVELGNLVANAPLLTLERLVNKWLLGGDLPSPTAGGDSATGKAATTVGVYAKSSGTLVLDGVTPGDIKQGQLGDCFLAAALVSVADAKPGAITSMVVDNGIVDGSHSWGVRFFNAQGQAQWVTVNDMLPVREAGSTTLVYGANPQGDLNGEIWFPLIEKAYAQANTLKILPRSEQIGVNGYWGIEGGFGDPIASVLGGKVTAYVYTENVSFGNNDYITIKYVNRADPVALADYQAIVLAALNGGKAVWIGSDKKTTDAFDNTLLTGGHAFSAIDANKADPNSAGVSVWNPWGVKSLPNPPANVGHLSPFDTYDVVALIGITEIYLMIGG